MDTGFILPSKYYEPIKRFITVIAPAFSALYLGLDGLWDLPAEAQVVGTVALVTAFLGIALGISTKNYTAHESYGGELVVTETDEGKAFRMVLEASPEELAANNTLTFKVNTESL